MKRIQRRLPPWIKAVLPRGEEFFETKRLVQELRLHTVCEEARCPNIGECWGHRTATFMLLGDTCTRNCGFCAVSHGRPNPVDPLEPERVAQGVARLGLLHVVITSVDRDDLDDGGARHFARTVEAIKRLVPACTVEVLVPDFRPDATAIDHVVDSPVDVLNHNTETVPRLYKRVRPGATFERSIRLLERAKVRRPSILTKSGVMLGLGERCEELFDVFSSLRRVGCDILTLGQYLRPSAGHLPVERYVAPEEFASLKRQAERLGFRHVEAGPLVRSSYHAWEHVN
jgi:lipoic acid synthetase